MTSATATIKLDTGRFNRLLASSAAALAALMLLAQAARAGEASSSATASNNGAAAATAGYNGDGRGYVQTQTRSGNVTLARGVAVGVDQSGITFSASNAVAGRFLPASLASNLNITIGFNGQVASSGGISVAQGPFERTASAGGFASNNRFAGATAGSTAGGRTDRFGTVRANTFSRSTPARLPVARMPWRR
jgi:hypothetical protein